MKRTNSSAGFARSNEELISAFQRLADCFSIAAGHYFACLAYHDYWRSGMTVATGIALVTFNLLAESRGLYRRWRSEPIGRELTTAFAQLATQRASRSDISPGRFDRVPLVRGLANAARRFR